MKNTRHMAAFISTGTVAEPKSAAPAMDLNIRPGLEVSRETSRQPVIFVPFETTVPSLKVARSIVSTALRAGARMVLFHAVHLNLTPYGPANPAWIKAALRQEAVEMAEPVMRYAEGLGVPVICVVEEGSPTSTMVKAAAKWEADVIVLPAQERSWLGKWFERRTLDRVIRAAGCPVMVLDTAVTA